VLERVNRLAVDVTGCDFASLFLMDERRNVYWLASNVGSRPEVVAELTHLEFPPDSLPLLRMLRPGELVTIADASRETRVPPELNRRLDVASALYAPVARRDRIIGVLVVGYGKRIGAFSSRERRLALGIAHTTAITLENGRLIADLQSANRLKSEFVATMSHELRTPLNVIMGYTEMLADRVFDPGEPEWEGTIARIQEHAIGLLELVNATLDMGRLESGRETVAVEEVDVARLLSDLARELKPLAPPGVTLTWISGISRGPILSDAVKLKTILKNLIGNALKFTQAGSVHVEARPTADHEGTEEITFSVADSGIGIAPEDVSMIFEMFRQVDSSSTRRFSGVGLGLHIAKRLVELLGGTIRVQSTPGVGSTFTLTMPLRRPTVAVGIDEPRRAAQ
jgi:signal transduction histidine kinase